MKFLKNLLGICIVFGSSAASNDLNVCLQANPSSDPKSVLEACVIVQDDPSFSRKQNAEIHSQMGVALRNLGKLNRSETTLRKAIELDPKNAEHLRMLAWTLRESNKLNEAERIYTDSLKIEDHWQAWLSRCVVRQDMESYSNAEPDCARAVKMRPNLKDAIFFHARSLNHLERFQEAFELAKRGMGDDEKTSRMVFEAAYALWGLSQNDTALGLLKVGLQTYKDDASLLWLIEQIQR